MVVYKVRVGCRTHLCLKLLKFQFWHVEFAMSVELTPIDVSARDEAFALSFMFRVCSVFILWPSDQQLIVLYALESIHVLPSSSAIEPVTPAATIASTETRANKALQQKMRLDALGLFLPGLGFSASTFLEAQRVH